MENMLPDLQFSLICEDVIQDKMTGKLIFHGVFDAISAPEFPVTHQRLFIVNRWCNGDGKFSQKVKIVSAKREKIIEEKDVKFSLLNTKSKHTVVGRFDNIILKESGIHWVEVYLDGDLKLSYPFEVKKLEAER